MSRPPVSPAAAKPLPWRPYVAIWAALMLLLALSLGVAYLPIGRVGTVVGLVIALIKASLVAVVYMELGRSASLLRLTVAAGCLFAFALFALTFTDVLTRP